MAAFALLNTFVELNSVDLSDRVKSATLTLDANELDPTAMGDDWKVALGGVKSGSLAIEFLDDYAAGETDATIWAAFGTVVPFKVRPDAGAVSATNPTYSGSVLVTSISSGGSHGELAMKSLTFPTSGEITRATS
jgi:hypothetical protein